MYKLAINRPITTLMLFLSLVIFGIFSLYSMPINLYPNVKIPLIKITALSSGDLEYVKNRVTKEIENAVSDIEGIETIGSKIFNNLSVSVIKFKLGKDLEIAANDIREKLGKINLEYSPSIEKISTDASSVVNIFVSTKNDDKIALMRFVDKELEPYLKRVDGVGKIEKIGFLEPRIKVELDLATLEKYHINSYDVMQILKSQNFKIPLGKIENKQEKYILKGTFDASSIDELKDIRIIPGVFLKDIADVSVGLSDENSYAFYKGKSGVMLEISKVENTNAIKVIENIKNAYNKANDKWGKNYDMSIAFDKSENILKHIHQVRFDMIFGVFLTIVIVFLFLRSVSATIIASISIPTSIVATFFLIHILGNDLNRLTLIALTLSIGIFIDDAIVVIENISKYIQKGKDSLNASYEAIKDIGFSVLSISVVLLCVFIPISYMNSVPGLFFNTLGLSTALGVIISFFVSMMLIPSLSARFLSNVESNFYHKSEKYFVALEEGYAKILNKILKYKKSFVLLVFVVFVACVSLTPKIGLNFLPMEDDSEILVNLKSTKNITIDTMKDKGKEVLSKLKNYDEIEYAYLLIGYDDSKDSKLAKIYVKLKNLSNRNLRQAAFVQKLRNELKLDDVKIKIIEVPKFEGAGVDEPVQFVLLGDDIKELRKSSQKTKELLSKDTRIVDIDDDMDALEDEIVFELDKEKAKKLNVNPYDVAMVLKTSFDDNKLGNLDYNNLSDDIVLRLSSKYKKDINTLNKIEIKSMDGTIIGLMSILHIKEKQDISNINRTDRQDSIKITAGVNDISLAEVQKLLEDNKNDILVNGVDYKFSGFIDMLGETVEGFATSVGLACLLIYLVLASLYESLLLPFVVMISMPLAFAGACVGLFITANTFSLFVLVALILLFGMVGKNAILLVDVANKLCEEGVNSDEALIIAGKKRIRAILMTTIAMIAAMLPLALSHGAGYEGNSPMAISVIYGLISSTLLTLFAVPAIFGVIYKIDSKIKKIYKREKI